MRTLILSLCTFLVPSALAAGEEEDIGLLAVWYTSHQCPPIEPGSPGATRETAITLTDFSDPYYAAMEQADEASETGPPPSQYECRWVRLSGFVNWMHYYHYRGTLVSSAGASYGGSKVRYIIEKFTEPEFRRTDVVHRRVTVVGRFYDLCAAAEREQAEAGENWWLFGPCHYGNDQGMMLDDVRVERIHDAGPQYILGERNRAVLAQLPRVEGVARGTLIERTRSWAELVRKGPSDFADAHFSAYPVLATQPEDEQREIRQSIESADGFIAYASARLSKVSVRDAPVEVFWNHSHGESQDDAFGCVCLTGACEDSWPVVAGDADYFFGDAVCTELEFRNGEWRW